MDIIRLWNVKPPLEFLRVRGVKTTGRKEEIQQLDCSTCVCLPYVNRDGYCTQTIDWWQQENCLLNIIIMTLDCGVLDKLDHVDTVLADRGFAIQSDLLLPPPASGLGQRYLFMYCIFFDLGKWHCYAKLLCETSIKNKISIIFFLLFYAFQKGTHIQIGRGKQRPTFTQGIHWQQPHLW
mgnify:CR=1 FL=1